MSNTQKNWNDFWNNYEPSRNDIVYKNMNDKGKQSNFGIKHILTAFLVTIIILGTISVPAIINEYSKPEQKPIQTTKANISLNNTYKNNIVDNVNGKTMTDNVHLINKIIIDVSKDMPLYTEEDFDNFIIKIKNADLGSCYDEYKGAAVKKVMLARSINNSTDTNIQNELIERYNDIELFDYLEAAFDKADVEYWRDETEIHYKYKE
jgi:hypothetical protein